MKYNLLLILGFWVASMNSWADSRLEEPLTFVSADSVVVWGEDRSDYRTTALSVAAQLQVRPVQVERVVKKQLQKDRTHWQKELLPSLNLSGAVADELGGIAVVPTAAMILQAGKLYLQTADAQYMDAVERAALNALMSVAVPGDLSFEKHIAAQALMNTSGMVYATDAEGVYVNLYINSSTHIQTEQLDFVLDQLTAMPHEGRVKLRMGGLKSGLQPIKVRLRMPNWACGTLPDACHFGILENTQTVPAIYVNGREEHYPVVNGYLVIDRKWNSGDEVYFDFPFKVQHLYPRQQEYFNTNVVALQRGPLLYGFMQPTEGFSYTPKDVVSENLEPNGYGHTTVSVPVTMFDTQKKVQIAEPLMDGAKYIWMNVTK